MSKYDVPAYGRQVYNMCTFCLLYTHRCVDGLRVGEIIYEENVNYIYENVNMAANRAELLSNPPLIISETESLVLFLLSSL